MSNSPSLDFIHWKPEYDCPVRLINCQHQEEQNFLMLAVYETNRAVVFRFPVDEVQ